jgi:lipid-A-disaccharide synthase
LAKYFIIAGEASGDIHAAELLKQIQLKDSRSQFIGLGGDQMVAAGCRIYQHIRHMAFMGYVAVLRNLGQVRRNFRIAEQALMAEQPDVLVLIDYPSFNLRMAAFCRKHLPHTKIYYYIPPKVWAWKKGRIHRIARLCDEVLGIFPFEPAFYARYGYHCTYVGHPTVEEMGRMKEEKERKKMIALLPGSRPSEISHCLPKMLAAARRFPEYRIVVSAAPGIEDAFYSPYLKENEQLTHDTYSAVQQAAAAVVNSGTATLETALLGCPQVAVYHIGCSGLLKCIKWAKPLIFSIPYFTPVNIIAGKEVIRECVAYDFTEANLHAELERILTDENYKKEMLANYEHLYTLLGAQQASVTAARIITSRP